METTVCVSALSMECPLVVGECEEARSVCSRVVEKLGLVGAEMADIRLAVDGEVVENGYLVQGGFQQLGLMLDYEKTYAMEQLQAMGVEVSGDALRAGVKELRVGVVSLLLKADVPVYREILTDAAGSAGPADTASLREIFELALSDGTRSPAWFHTADRMTAFHLCRTDHIPLVSQFGLDVNHRDVEGNAPLVYAVDDKERVEALLLCGAKVDIKDRNARTPLAVAAWLGFQKIVEILVEAGASVNHKDYLGSTPLHKACENGHIEIVRYLLSKGAQKNNQDLDGYTPLHRAAASAYADVVAVLITAGADVNIRNRDDAHPYQTAQHAVPPGKYAETVQTILKALPPPPLKRRLLDAILCCDVGYESRKRFTGRIYMPPDPHKRR